ncbi:MAG TPA: phasin family protein [Vicinamibacteria bacterium]|nr:phasin family protein [Vicinamibacteria bacterium]
MPAKKKVARRRYRRPASRVRTVRATPIGRAARRLEKTWKDTRAALTTAEATVERRVKAFARRSGVDTRQAAQTLQAWRARLDRERKKAMKQVEGRLAVVQTRARRERRALGRTVDEAVRRTLAALNIPSRHEVQELTHRVEELSRRIDRFRR